MAMLIGMTPNPLTLGQLNLSWGVVPMAVDVYDTVDEMVWCVVEAASKSEFLHSGNLVAVLAGAPDSAERTTDVLRIVRLS